MLVAAVIAFGSVPALGPALAAASDPAETRANAAASRDLDRELKRIRHQYFRASRNADLHTEGLNKLRAIAADPRSLHLLLRVFEDEDASIRTAVYDLVAAGEDPAAGTALAERAVFADEAEHRAEVRQRLAERYRGRAVPDAVHVVIAAGLQRERNETVVAAAGLAEALNVIEAIPLIAASQVQGGVPRETRGALAQIYVARQRTFVSDLQPVVGDGAVGFDPELSVVSEGTILRIFDAHVVTYRTEVHASLRRLAASAVDEDVPDLGWLPGPWIRWYQEEVVPSLIERERLAERQALPERDQPGG